MIEYKQVKIPSTPEDWQLYCDMSGAGVAAAALTQAAKEAVDLIADAKLRDAQSVQARALRVINEAQHQHADVGAYDSEPHVEAQRVVIRAMKVIAGVEVDPGSL
ncbi:hypothetical protein DB30_07661 [Enhygromyxa salina]|uniref:Uncharacterized protein n=1 Tax=Enhygromyxa salina TaxID=215803 RepID=A0A0C2D659_9BACT|nr:hypothetical protein [Enhygromyxa salina]KIG18646.1 hypothetical protein DB30_07661 [Enhygromyxa salina]